MSAIAQFFGALSVIIGVVVTAFGVFAFFGRAPDWAFVLAISGISSMVTGACLYLFGQMADHLKAIRVALEKQATTTSGK